MAQSCFCNTGNDIAMQSGQHNPESGKRSKSPLKIIMLTVVAIGIFGGIYFLTVHSPISEAGAAMRVARYDIALSALGNIPARFSDWPGVPLQRTKVMLGVRTYRDPPEWDTIGDDLRTLRAAHPSDPDLLVLEARYLLRKPDYDKAGLLAEQAVKSDNAYAEGWFLLGVQREHTGDSARAVDNFRIASEKASDSPLYRSSLARALLEAGKTDDALAEFRKVRDFPLARLDEAMAHWAKGDMRQALAAQREALGMLENTELSGRYYNRREWMYRLAPGANGVRLASREEKLCYARLGESASRALAGESAAAVLPPGCERAPKEMHELLAAQLCRFVDKPQPALRQTAGRLRRALGQSEHCPA